VFGVWRLTFLLSALPLPGAPPGYADPALCAGCHKSIAESYNRTGMGRSFYRPDRRNTVEDYTHHNTFFHQASDEHYTMYERDGRYYQRRHQTGPDGREINVIELQVDYVLGSGNHVRSYVHRGPDGRLLELPVAWYAERGGFWEMNPGYERADHMDFRRPIDRECFFCHNAYPDTPDSAERELTVRGAIPEGIDCQRCHGPGGAHAEKPTRGSILNPARLSRERQLEVCFQCHLESTSRSLPYSIRRYGRGFFSYRPGEPLAGYIVHFDHAPGTGYEDKFEISHAAYRLLKSACFRKSGTLTCTTCHDPHGAPRPLAQACRSCHADSHHPAENCVDCHMPKRRTDDVPHAMMTDHYIQRQPAPAHAAPAATYRGEVVPLYPASPDELYLAVAQVVDGANLQAGIPRLERAIQARRPAQAEFYLELANAYAQVNQHGPALAYYQETLRRRPRFPNAQRNYALALERLGRWSQAIEVLEPLDDSASLNQLGEAWLQVGQPDRAVATLLQALRTAPDLPEAYVNLGAALLRRKDTAGAEAAFRSAILHRPNLPAAHMNLAAMRERAPDFAEAEYHYRRALRGDPESAMAHYNYGRALAQRNRLPEAEQELRAALRIDAQFAEAATSLGLVLSRSGQIAAAIEQYRRAIQLKPEFAAAHFNLALILGDRGEIAEARRHLETVLRADPADFQAHLYLGKFLLAEGQKEAGVAHLRKAAESPRPEVRAAAREAMR
jgi:tetratricopeptide (TPR) repeat protein